MQPYDYRVVPAPRRGVKVRGARGEEARFAAAVEAEMNRMGAHGWEYVRSDTLPSEEKQGWLGGRATVFRTLLVFRRERAIAREAAPAVPTAAEPAPPPMLALPVAEPVAEPLRPTLGPAPPRLAVAEGLEVAEPQGPAARSGGHPTGSRRIEPRLAAE